MAIQIPGPKKPSGGTLLDNASSVDKRWYEPRTPAPGPVWQKWLNLPELELWKAIALSCGVEPPAYFPEGLDEEFDLRMAIAIAHVTPAGSLSNVVRNKRPHMSIVRLADIARLAGLSAPPWILPPQFPLPSTSAQINTTSDLEKKKFTEQPTPPEYPDPERRLALLRELGGTATLNRSKGDWTFTGIAGLVASEKAAGRKRKDEKTIRADLKIAAQDERDAKAAGPFHGLGQR